MKLIWHLTFFAENSSRLGNDNETSDISWKKIMALKSEKHVKNSLEKSVCERYSWNIHKDRERPDTRNSNNIIQTKYNVSDINFSYSKGYNENISFERDNRINHNFNFNLILSEENWGHLKCTLYIMFISNIVTFKRFVHYQIHWSTLFLWAKNTKQGKLPK